MAPSYRSSRDEPVEGRQVRVLAFVPSLGSGGAEMHLVRVLNNIDRSRFRPAVAVARSGGSYEKLLASAVEYHDLGCGWLPSSGLRMLASVKPLRHLLARWRPDVLLSVMDHANLAAHFAMRGRSTTRHVLSVQVAPSANYANEQSLFNAVVKWGVRRYYRYADTIIALSRGVADDLGTISPGAGGKVQVIYNAGVDERVEERREEALGLHRPAEGEVIVACGRLTEQKGFAYLLEAFWQVRQRRNVELWVLGEGELDSALKQKAEALSVGEAVRWLGFRQNPYKYMSAGDVFVLSSLWEGFGNVLVEAMACGTAVVSTDCPYGPGEIITNGEDGLLVPPANPSALARAILCVLEDRQLRDKLVRNGLRRAEDFSAKKIASAYAGIFEHLAATG